MEAAPIHLITSSHLLHYISPQYIQSSCFLLDLFSILMYALIFFSADEYCQSDMFEPACGSDEVIVMQTAQYGRIQLGKCLTENFGFMDCKSDVISVLDRKCSGKRQCSVKVEDSVFPAVPACHKDLKSYLAASYSCIRGESTAVQMLVLSTNPEKKYPQILAQRRGFQTVLFFQIGCVSRYLAVHEIVSI